MEVAGGNPINLVYVGCGRVRGGNSKTGAVLLASLCHPEFSGSETDTAKTFEQILTASKHRLVPGQRQRLIWQDSTISILMSYPAGDMLYGVVCCSKDYPDRITYELLTELSRFIEANYAIDDDFTEKNSLNNEKVQLELRRLLDRYERPEEVDKLARMQQKTEGVKGLLKENIREVIQNTERLDNLQEDAEAMEVTAMEYKEKSREVREYFWWKDTKVSIMIGGAVVLALLLGYYFFWHNGAETPPPPDAAQNAPPPQSQ
ncbi:unnamed protein product [Amoebophrya sp. A120]|nr:unnamed protein product [Amoebophrya sp. A120]|eukprot:GSA120T00006613001.1